MFEVNGVTNVVVRFDASTMHCILVWYENNSIRWNESLGIFESCNAGTSYVTNMLVQSGIEGYSQDAHVDVESLPTTADIGYRVVSS